MAAGFSLGLSAAASAADMALKAPPPVPLFDWSGWYGGVNTGYSWGSSRATTDSVLLAATYTEPVRHQGWEASVEGGYCWQQPATTVVCIEARYDFLRERSGQTLFDGIPTTPIYNQTQVDPFLIGPHLGYLTDSNHTMLYVAGGLAVGEVGGNSTITGPGGTSTANPSDKWTAGWFVGAGIEHMIDQHWGVKVEYDYVRFASSNGACAPYVGNSYAALTGSGSTSCLGGNASDNVVTVGINYHLGTH
jgi:outer membrane immunogenic protein